MRYELHDNLQGTFITYRSRDSLLRDLYVLYSKSPDDFIQNICLNKNDTFSCYNQGTDSYDRYRRRWLLKDEFGRTIDLNEWLGDIACRGAYLTSLDRRKRYSRHRKARKHRCYFQYGRRAHSQHRNRIADSKLLEYMKEFYWLDIKSGPAVNEDMKLVEMWFDPRVRSEKGNCWKNIKCRKQWQKHKGL